MSLIGLNQPFGATHIQTGDPILGSFSGFTPRVSAYYVNDTSPEAAAA